LCLAGLREGGKATDQFHAGAPLLPRAARLRQGLAKTGLGESRRRRAARRQQDSQGPRRTRAAALQAQSCTAASLRAAPGVTPTVRRLTRLEAAGRRLRGPAQLQYRHLTVFLRIGLQVINEAAHQRFVGPGDEHLRVLEGGQRVQNEDGQRPSDSKALSRNLLFGRQEALHLAQVHKDVATVHAVDESARQPASVAAHVRERPIPLEVSQLAHHRRVTDEGVEVAQHVDTLALGAGDEVERLGREDFAEAPADRASNVDTLKICHCSPLFLVGLR